MHNNVCIYAKLKTILDMFCFNIVYKITTFTL